MVGGRGLFHPNNIQSLADGLSCALPGVPHFGGYDSGSALLTARPNASETPATIKLRSILKTPEVTKILQGEKLTAESQWAENPWLISAVLMYGRLAYKFEGMTDMINGAFMEDISELLNSATGDQRRRKSFYEIDTEKMTASLLKNFNSMASLMPFLRVSLRQTMIRKLATVGEDKDGWKKADEHLGSRAHDYH
jgi:hypothetical protein